MNEAEWLACTDPRPLLAFLRGKVSDRKLRLFAMLCCQQAWPKITDEYFRSAIVAVEAFAENSPTQDELDEADVALFGMSPAAFTSEAIFKPATYTAIQAATAWYGNLSALSGCMAWASAYPPQYVASETPPAEASTYEATRRKALIVQARFLRCIFGNLFRPVILEPSHRTPTLTALAQAIYDKHNFTAMPILADALEEAGCTNADTLAHCRGIGPHVRGCWVVDLLLGKE